MKHNLFAILLCILIPFPLLAQEGDIDDVRNPQARERIKAAHAAYITQRLELTANEAERFWPVYREYGEKRREVRMQMRELRRAPGTGDVLQRDLQLKQKELDIEKEYMDRLGKIIPSEKLVKLREAEADFRRLLLRQLQERRRQRR